MDFYYKTSLYECIYLADELIFPSSTITGIALYNQFAVAPTNGATKIYLGTTQQTDLSNGFIPATELSLVFDGNVDFPTGSNTINITFQTPYMHTPGNLVMMVLRPMDTQYYSSSNYFKCQTVGSNRGRYLRSDSTTYDPNSPAAGTLTNQFPKVTIFYTSQEIENDLAAVSITGSRTPTVGVATPYTIRIRNNGNQAQNTYTVKLMGPDNVELVSVAGPAVASLQTVDVEIPWTPTTPGAYSIYGKLELAGDEFEVNNQTQPLSLMINPAGVFTVTVGDGSQTLRAAYGLLLQKLTL